MIRFLYALIPLQQVPTVHASIQLYEPNLAELIQAHWTPDRACPCRGLDVVSVHSRSLTVGWGMRSTSVYTF